MSEATPQSRPKRKRRWLRYSLRSFLLLLTIACLLFGYWVHRANRQRAAVEWVRQNEGDVIYYYEYNENGWNRYPKPPILRFLEPVLGVDYFSSVRSVWLYRVIDDQDLAPIAHFDRLRRLELPQYNYNGQVSDLSALADLTELEVLRLGGQPVSDLSPLARLENLRLLHLSGTLVSDISPLSDLKRLESLDLSYTRVSDVSPLAALTKLHNLNLDGTQVRDIRGLNGLANLSDLWLQNTKVTDLTPLKGLKKLRRLHLYNSPVHNLTPLHDVKGLAELGISDCPVSSEELRKLSTALPGCTISK